MHIPKSTFSCPLQAFYLVFFAIKKNNANVLFKTSNLAIPTTTNQDYKGW